MGHKLSAASIAIICGLAWQAPAHALVSSSVTAAYDFSVSISGDYSWAYDAANSFPLFWHGTGAAADNLNSFDDTWGYTQFPLPPDASSLVWDDIQYAADAGVNAGGSASANRRNYPVSGDASQWQLGGHRLQSSSSAAANPDAGNTSRAIVERWGSILATGSGTVTVTATAVGDGLSVDLAADVPDGSAYGGANAYNNFWVFDNAFSTKAETRQNVELKRGAFETSLSAVEADGLQHSYSFVAGDYVQFFYGVNSLAGARDIGVNPVPLPAAAWLMLSALLGLAGYRKLAA